MVEAAAEVVRVVEVEAEVEDGTESAVVVAEVMGSVGSVVDADAVVVGFSGLM